MEMDERIIQTEESQIGSEYEMQRYLLLSFILSISV